MIKCLVRKGVPIEFKGVRGSTALLCACHMGNFRVVRYLISKGANIEASTERGMTPLVLSVESGVFRIVEYLLSRGADTESVDYSGRTSLSLSYINMRPDISLALIRHGASFDTPDIYGYTPSDYFSRSEDGDMFADSFTRIIPVETPDDNHVLPVENFSDGTHLSVGVGSECCVCLNIMKKVEPRSFLECGHVFHTECLKGWMGVKHTCPVDRSGFSEYCSVRT